MKRFWLFIGLLLGVFAQPLAAQGICQPSYEPGFTCGSSEFHACEISVGGQRRQYCLHVPDQLGPLPVVLAFHGAGGHAKSMTNLWGGFTEQSAIIAAPQAGHVFVKNDCVYRWRQIGTPIQDWHDMEREDVCDSGPMRNDLDFTDALLKELRRHHEVSGFYASGFSNGAGFVLQLLLTEELAKEFSGFAAAGMGIGLKLRSAAAATKDRQLDYHPNHDIRRPILFQMGTEDKKTLEPELLARAVKENEAECLPIESYQEVFECLLASRVEGGSGLYDMPTRRRMTQEFLVEFNNAEPRAHESLYPNLGLGQAPEDETLTVRQDFLAKRAVPSATVSVLTTVNGGHAWPGWGGNRAPCDEQNCDVDLVREIIQFWRAHAGMKLPVKR